MGVEQIENLGGCRQMAVEGLQSEQNGWDVMAALGVDLDLSNGGLSCKRPVKYRSAAATGVPMGTGRLEGGEQVGLPDPAHSALGSYAALFLSACRAFCQ